MQLIVIGIVKNRSLKRIGYRLLDMDTKNWIDASQEQIKERLDNGIKIYGLKLKGSQVCIVGGGEDYPVIVDNELYKNNNIIIGYRRSNGSYTAYDFTGNTAIMDNLGLQKFEYGNKVANAKFDGQVYIGDFEVEQQKDQEEVNKNIKNKAMMVRKFSYNFDENGMFILTEDEPKERLKIPNGVKGVGTLAFNKQPNLVEVVISEGIETLSEYSFNKCPKLETIRIEEGVREIPAKFACECPKLKKVILPNSVDKVEDFAFYGCRNLKEVEVGSRKTEFKINALPKGVRKKIRN